SSGSAVAVSAGLSLVSTGTDTGGSIRQPASFCGVVGLKPTYGAVSRYGIVAMASSLDSPGVISLTVADAKAVFDVIKGEDGFDSTVKNSPPVKPKGKIKIGIPKEYFGGGLDPEVEKCVMEASRVFAKEGMEIVDISLPHTKYAIDVYYIIQPAEVASNLGRYDGIRYGGDRSAFGPEAVRRIMLGTYVLSAGYYDAYYLKAQKVRSRIIEDFNQAFRKVDLILAPVSPTPAFKLGEKSEDPVKMYLADILTAPANVSGIPGIALPFGFSKSHLPLGFQLLGPRYSEDTLFEAGEMFERATDYKPKLAI
ncbi:MAG TPA: amidase family protein, partial [Patescibacteria group bacterium]|nr:amidase family protein [Patescibacteria group bacterium]